MIYFASLDFGGFMITRDVHKTSVNSWDIHMTLVHIEISGSSWYFGIAWVWLTLLQIIPGCRDIDPRKNGILGSCLMNLNPSGYSEDGKEKYIEKM